MTGCFVFLQKLLLVYVRINDCQAGLKNRRKVSAKNTKKPVTKTKPTRSQISSYYVIVFQIPSTARSPIRNGERWGADIEWILSGKVVVQSVVVNRYPNPAPSLWR